MYQYKARRIPLRSIKKEAGGVHVGLHHAPKTRFHKVPKPVAKGLPRIRYRPTVIRICTDDGWRVVKDRLNPDFGKRYFSESKVRHANVVEVVVEATPHSQKQYETNRALAVRALRRALPIKQKRAMGMM